MEPNWDKVVAAKLRAAGFTQGQIGFAVGEIAEHRQIADLQGYIRGFNKGYEKATIKTPTPYCWEM